jgi:membrane-bound lytic murein transglycosylase D
MLFLLCIAWASTARSSGSSPVFDEPEVIKRIELMNSEVAEPKYDIVVRSYLRTYLVNNRKVAEIILGRRILYFPMFEDYLRQNNIPTDLKYLAIVESALEPKAISHAGAVGLWQFMPGTGRGYGLRVDELVDERRDPHKSTQAASQYLMDLFEKFQNWELAIAAYNSGSGRVSRAVKRGRSTSYWKIRAHLPRETRNYVPAFIAATYLMRYFEDHDLQPNYPDLDLQMTETISVFKSLHFQEVARVTGLSEEAVAQLNPAFIKGMAPANKEGYYFTLPRRVMAAFRAFLESERPDYKKSRFGVLSSPVMVSNGKEAASRDYLRSSYLVKEGETLENIARRLNCSAYQIRAWNQMTPSQEIQAGQELVLFQLKEALPLAAIMVRVEPLEELPASPPPPLTPRGQNRPLEQPLMELRDRAYIYYQVRIPESIHDISLRFRIDVQQLRNLNGVRHYRNLKPGTYLKIAGFQNLEYSGSNRLSQKVGE